MSFKTEHDTFTTINKAAFAVFSTVAEDVKTTREKWQMRLVKAGIAPEDYRVFAMHWVYAQTGVAPRMGQRGWTYDGGPEVHMIDDIVKALKGQTDKKLEGRKAARKAAKAAKAAKAVEVSPAALKAAKALLKACNGDIKAAAAALEAAK